MWMRCCVKWSMVKSTRDAAPMDVVIGPDVIVRSFFCPANRRILNLWRDGRLRPVVSQALLQETVRILRAVNLPDGLVRQWALWLTAEDHTFFLRGDLHDTHESMVATLLAAAARAETSVVVTRCHPPSSEQDSMNRGAHLVWMTPEEFLSRHFG